MKLKQLAHRRRRPRARPLRRRARAGGVPGRERADRLRQRPRRARRAARRLHHAAERPRAGEPHQQPGHGPAAELVARRAQDRLRQRPRRRLRDLRDERRRLEPDAGHAQRRPTTSIPAGHRTAGAWPSWPCATATPRSTRCAPTARSSSTARATLTTTSSRTGLRTGPIAFQSERSRRWDMEVYTMKADGSHPRRLTDARRLRRRAELVAGRAS